MFFRIIHPPPQFCILYIFLFLFAIFIGFLPKKVLAIHLTKCYNEAHNSAELVEYTKEAWRVRVFAARCVARAVAKAFICQWEVKWKRSAKWKLIREVVSNE